MNNPAVNTAVLEADRNARIWQGTEPSPIRPGSEEHKRLFCRMLIETFNPYKPAVLDWPSLTPEERDRLTGLPIWDIAVQTEGRASLRVLSYAEEIADPLLREAVELNGFEERRHKDVLSNLVEAYNIELEPEPAYVRPRDAEWAFMKTGYSECIDSFFAFGLFDAAKQSGYFPPALVETFEPVIQEEGRHILFFVNWVAWHRRNMPVWRRPLFTLKTLLIWSVILWERLVLARSLDGGDGDTNFTATGVDSMSRDMDIATFIDTCLSENERRMSGYDARLLRPLLVPRLVRFARRFIKGGKPA